jgi:hypothetical protein
VEFTAEISGCQEISRWNARSVAEPEKPQEERRTEDH